MLEAVPTALISTFIWTSSAGNMSRFKDFSLVFAAGDGTLQKIIFKGEEEPVEKCVSEGGQTDG